MDVGSASVAVAIVISEPGEPQPTVVWHHTERCAIGTDADLLELAKRIAATVVNVSLEVSGLGLKALSQHDSSMRIDSMQVAVAAPWSYTVPKSVHYSADEAFTVDEKLIAELTKSAEDTATEQYANNQIFESLGLEVIDSSTTHYAANGYAVTDPVGQTLQELTLVRQLTICQKQLLDAVRKAHETIIPRARLSIRSFMQHMQSQVLRRVAGSTTHALVDISGDATEVGIVVDGLLQNVINNSWGHYAVARELAVITQQPPEAALALMRETQTGTVSDLPTNQQLQYESVRTAFAQKLTELITRTAKMSELPSHYLIHSDTGMRTFAESILRQAVQSIGTTEHSISLVSEKLIDVTALEESRLALSVAVFHTNGAK